MVTDFMNNSSKMNDSNQNCIKELKSHAIANAIPDYNWSQDNTQTQSHEQICVWI